MNFPLRYLYNDRKLRDRALTEFARALRNDRMIALTGSMSDEALGYFSWKDFEKRLGGIAIKLTTEIKRDLGDVALEEPVKSLIRAIRKQAGGLSRGGSGKMQPRVRFGIIRDCFEALAELPVVKRLLGAAAAEAGAGQPAEPTSPRSRFNARVAELFRKRQSHPAHPSAIRPLLESLGISRVATLNYDLELERAFMLRGDEHKRDVNGQKTNRPVMEFIGEPSSGKPIERDNIHRWSRVMGDGLTVESDIMNRERPDRLFEFAIGSAEVARHIVHLHGRADLPDSMIVTMRDYDRLYRLDDLFRNPFEHGMRVLFAGNPVLFVGLGMTESELNDFLQYFVSNTPYRRMAPAFLIWNTLGFGEKDSKGRPSSDPATRQRRRLDAMKAMRIDFLQRLGIHVIFDEDVADLPFGEAAGSTWLDDLRCRHDAHDEADTESKRAVRLEGLVKLIEKLPAVAQELRASAHRAGDGTWRSIRPRLEPTSAGAKRAKVPDAGANPPGNGFERTPPGPVRIWGTVKLKEFAEQENALKLPQLKKKFVRTSGKGGVKEQAMLVGVGPPGAGRGEFSERVGQIDIERNHGLQIGDWIIQRTDPMDRLIVNAGFSYDSDALLNSIALFLKLRNADPARFGDPFCRERHFADESLFDVKNPALIIINGVDRFFGFDGQPLSAEFDHLIRCIHAASPDNQLQWLLLGTERIRGYFASFDVPMQGFDPGLLDGPADAAAPVADDRAQSPDAFTPPVEVKSKYLDWVASQFAAVARDLPSTSTPDAFGRAALPDGLLNEAARARLSEALTSDTESVRRAFFSAYLAPALLRSLGLDCPTTFELLRTFAFIGSPVEAAVLLHAPKVVAILDERRKTKTREQFLVEALEKLEDLGLILSIIPHLGGRGLANSGIWKRYSLHRALATELRERHGAPISEAKLSTTFNMSLFAAQPGDTYLPDERFHDELGELVDRLVGAWKDEPQAPPHEPGASKPFPVSKEDFIKHEAARQLIFRPENAQQAYDMFRGLCARHSAVCLRAALSVVRGYYSTSSLLTLGAESRLVAEAREGALSEHAERIDRILKSFGKIATARHIFRDQVPRGQPEALRQKEISTHLGAEPFYPDDLVWLHNERGVIKLAQGHLYDARRSFSLAEKANDDYLELGHHGHNWRRINLNTVGLLIERGQLRRAERRIDAVEASVDNAAWCKLAADGDPSDRVKTIRNRFSDRTEPIISCETREFTREELLVVALTTSYRAVIAHMRGQYRAADLLYESGLAMLRRLKEVRAYSMFQRHYATFGRHIGSPDEVAREIHLAIAAADSVQQMDISHRSRIVRARHIRTDPSSTAKSRRTALQDLHRALNYAALTDAYRVRIEASSGLAQQMRETGDYDTALRYASDALAIACRYGHSLHKIALRVDIGQILIERGDPNSGSELLDRAGASAMRAGYHRIAERVQNARRHDRGLGESEAAPRTPADRGRSRVGTVG